MKLRDYQTRAIQKLREALASGFSRPVVQAPTGAGKTVVAAAIINMARAKDKKVLFCVPALSLIDQTVERFRQNGIFEIGVMQGQHEMTDYAQPVQVCSVQTLARRTIPGADLVIVDECHVSFKLIEDWMNRPDWKHVPFVGLTATPWAKGMGAPGKWDHLIIGSTLDELIKLGHLSDFRVYAPAHPDLAGVKTVAGDYDLKGLGSAMDKQALVADIVTTWLERGENRSTICFAVNRVHAKHIQNRFIEAGVKAEYMDAYTSLDDRGDIIKRFENGDIQVICNVGVLTTGFDADVRCIILARPTKSEILYCLDSETEILTSHGWKGIGQVKVGDCAATMSDVITGAGAWSPIVGVVERDMSSSESWVEYQAPRANFRTTDQHMMIAASMNAREPFKKMTAYEMAKLKGSVKMPTAVHMNQVGVPLTDAELYFIGIMMSDGTWTSTAGSISQSERHPEVIARIEQCLRECGIGYSKRKIDPPKEGEIQERHARWVYNFSAGKPKAHGNTNRNVVHEDRLSIPVYGTTGFRHLLPYLDKDFAPSLMQMSKHQLDKFIQGLWDGDGSKKKTVDYVPRSMEICSARKVMIDCLQALCSINGYTAHMRMEHGSRTNPIYFITITPKDWRSCGGYASISRDPRPQIEIKPATNERVWCVETLTGTIITRRKGKVTVMGNCQMIGRGLRTAKGKQDCLILDHSDTTLRLGFVTDIGTDKLHDGTGNRQAVEKKAPLPKECPACTFLKPPKARKCPACGFEPVAVSEVRIDDGELQELSRNGNVKPEKFTMEQKQDWYRQLILHANLRGYKPGWAYWAYKDKFKVGPDHSLDPRPAVSISYEVQNWITARNIRKAKAREKAA
jgi:superfamily II DNA or RNA helicase